MDKLLERWMDLPLAPGGAVVAAAMLFVVIALLLRPIARPRTRVSTILRWGALAVLVAWVGTCAAQFFSTSLLPWTRLALPLVLAAAAIGASMIRRRPSVGAPHTDVPLRRRSWSSFVSTGWIRVGATLAAALTVITVVCGLVASDDGTGGAAVWLIFGDGAMSFFYGWPFGLPVLIAAALLICVCVLAWGRIAAPPFAAGQVAEESRARATDSNRLAALATASFGLTMGAVVELIGYSGTGAAGVGIPGVGEFVFTTDYAAFAPSFVIVGWAAQVLSLALLMAVAADRLPASLLGPGAHARVAEKEGAS